MMIHDWRVLDLFDERIDSIPRRLSMSNPWMGLSSLSPSRACRLIPRSPNTASLLCVGLVGVQLHSPEELDH